MVTITPGEIYINLVTAEADRASLQYDIVGG